MLDPPALAARATEDAALADVVGGPAQRVVSDADRLDRDQDRFSIWAVENLVEARALTPDQVGVQNEQIADEDRVRIDRVAA